MTLKNFSNKRIKAQKLNMEQVKEIKIHKPISIKIGAWDKEIGEMYKVSQSAITDIRLKRTWKET